MMVLCGNGRYASGIVGTLPLGPADSSGPALAIALRVCRIESEGARSVTRNSCRSVGFSEEGSINVLARSRTWSPTFAGSGAVSVTLRGPVMLDQSPARESNPVRRLRRPACDRHTRRELRKVSALARSRTWSATFGGSRAIPSHSKGFKGTADGWIRTSVTWVQDRGLAARPRRRRWVDQGFCHVQCNVFDRIRTGVLRLTSGRAACCTTNTAEGAGVEPARLFAHPRSRRGPSPIG